MQYSNCAPIASFRLIGKRGLSISRYRLQLSAHDIKTRPAPTAWLSSTPRLGLAPRRQDYRASGTNCRCSVGALDVALWPNCDIGSPLRVC